MLGYSSLDFSSGDQEVTQNTQDAINLFLSSVVDTNTVFTESDQNAIEQFLDDSGVGFTEKFGIQTSVALLDSDSNIVDTPSSILGISQLSVTDDKGNLLDLGAIQTTMKGISQSKETSVNIWGNVNFFLDDTLVDTKKIWASGQNVNTLDLSLVDSLTFDNTNTNSQFSSDIKSANAPSFSQQEKRNHTFTLSDEGRNWTDDSKHTYRVVITEVHAKLDSDKDVKEFNWSGQYIAYELTVTVVSSKKVVLQNDAGGNPKAVEIFKSDNTIQLCGQNIFQNPSHPINPFDSTATPPRVVVKDTSGNVLADVSHTVKAGWGAGHLQNTSYSNCSGKISGIPRGVELVFTVNGIDHTLTTPDHQVNYMLDARLASAGQYCQTESTSYNARTGCATSYAEVMHSNFGFGSPL